MFFFSSFFEFFYQGFVDTTNFLFKAKFRVRKHGVQSLCQSKFFKLVSFTRVLDQKNNLVLTVHNSY